MENSHWQPMTLGDFVTLQRGHDLPEHQRNAGKIPVLGSFGITGYHDTAKAKGPGVTVGRSGASFGVVNYSPVDYWPLNTALYVIDFHGNDEKFAYYFLKSLDFKRFNSGSAQPSLNRNFIHPIQVNIPPLDEQKAIAHILGTLDDKIELNQQMNRTLEAIARALFKSWFIDFDPVRAKLDGRQPAGMDAETAALFPAEFEDGGAIGKIPRGWKVGRLEDLIVLQRGFDLPKTARTPGKYPVLAASGPSGTHSEYKVKGPGVTTGRSGVLGNVFFVHEDFWPLNTSLWVKEFRHSRPIHAYHLLRGLNFEVFNAGSAVPTLNRNHVHGLPVIDAPLSVIEKFEEIVKPIFKQCRANEEQTVFISSLRDTLLPKLLSGEIRVKEAKKIVAEVA
jgi:type I restriction enzyme S subunit